MHLLVSLHQLERGEVTFRGELSAPDLAIETFDALIRLEVPLRYEFTVEKVAHELLVRGRLALVLHCQCVRCLEPFVHRLDLNEWTCYVPLEGEDRAVVEGDCVDLTPYVREDILLAFPQHPLCRPECPGLAAAERGKANTPGGGPRAQRPSVWAKLDKLRI